MRGGKETRAHIIVLYHTIVQLRYTTALHNDVLQ